MFKIIKKSKISNARLGVIKTPHGDIETPFFMPDATRGLVKNLSAGDLIALDLECLVANTLHLYLRPGMKLIRRAGGLHDFTGWPRSFLSDSGGYQVYSLIHNFKNGPSGRITDQGAIFRSPLDGSQIKLTPEQSIKIQFDLGAEMMVCFDDCPPNDYNNSMLETAVRRTVKWAERCKREYDKNLKKRSAPGRANRPLLIAVIQGGNNLALRKWCTQELIKIGFDGYGFGARHIDTEGRFLKEPLKLTAEEIPEDKLRFGLGIGLPLDLVKSAKLGYDMFDCVIPTREGRHGKLFFQKSNSQFPISNFQKKYFKFYNTVNITNAEFAKDFSAINEESKLPELRKTSKAYLNYLFKINDPQAGRLASLNNLEFYLKMLSDIKGLIKQNKF